MTLRAVYQHEGLSDVLGGTYHNVMLVIEEIGRIAGVELARGVALEPLKGRSGPFPDTAVMSI